MQTIKKNKLKAKIQITGEWIPRIIPSNNWDNIVHFVMEGESWSMCNMAHIEQLGDTQYPEVPTRKCSHCLATMIASGAIKLE